MDLDLSEDQKMIRTMARDFLVKECTKKYVREMEVDERGYSPDLWTKMVHLGWMGLPFPEAYGGGDGSFLDVVVLLEEMGRACLPGPFLPSVVLAGMPIAAVGNDDQKKKHLTAITQGKVLTFAMTEPTGSYDFSTVQTTAKQEGEAYSIDGTKMFVPDAHVADYLLCLARTGQAANGGLAVFIVDAKSKGLRTRVLKTIASDKQCEVVFNNVQVPAQDMLGRPGQGREIAEKVLQWAAIAKCAEMVGAGEEVLAMSAAYAKERVQFDKPIGTFQAIQHHCANMRLDIDGMRFLTYEAAWRLSQGLPADKEISMAKVWVSDAMRRVTRLGHQIHGGVGYITDHDMQLYFRRGEAAKSLYGDSNYHREALAGKLGL